MKDEERFIQLMEVLTETVLLDTTERMHANLVLSTFYHERNQSEEAERYIRKSGVVPERAWWILGPFDNAGVSAIIKLTYRRMPWRSTRPRHTKAQMEKSVGNRERIETFDGTVDLAPIFGFGDLNPALADMEQPDPQLDTVLAYAWTTVNSPDERQARIWISTLNTAKSGSRESGFYN